MNKAALLAMAKGGSKNKNIVKHNDLISVKMDLSLMQTRVFLATLAKISREDVDFKTYTIIVSDLLKECGVTSNNWHSQLKQEVKILSKKSIEIPRENKKDFLYTSLFSSLEYKSRSGILEVSFDPKLKPYLLQVKGNFTTYALKYVIQMKSPYSIRMYELLKQYATFGRRKFKIDFLRKVFSLEDKYPDFYDFKRRVLEKAKKDCEKYSDLTFTYKVIKQGRQPVEIDCIIQMKKVLSEEAAEDTQLTSIRVNHSDFVQELLDANLSEERVSEVLDKYPNEKYLKFVWQKCKAQNPKKLGGFFLKALQDGYYEKNFAEVATQQQAAQKKQQAVQQRKAIEKAEQEFNKKFNAFYNAAADRIEKETLSTRLEDREEFEAILQDKIKENPAWQISYDSYLKGDMGFFRNFLVRKYGKEYEYDKQMYKAYISQK